MKASLKQNIIANGFGQGWRALMSLAFVPIYIKYVGIESYGLIGIFALLQAWLTLLDMGMKPSLSREMARFTAGAHDSQSIRDLLWSIEVIGSCIAVVLFLAVWAASGWLASDWLKAGSLPVRTVARAFTVMGAVAAMRFIEDIYVSSLAGLQLQVHQNAVTAIMATVRGVGAIAILAWVSPTIEAFFAWQGVVSLATVMILGRVVRHALPLAPRAARFSRMQLRSIWHFAAGMMAITCLTLLLTQVDKILLSRLLTLKAYGYYSLAGVVAGGLSVLAIPITGAFYPRFTALITLGNHDALRTAYHQGAQMITVLMGSAAIILIMFHDEVMLLWTGDPVIVRNVAPLMAVMAFGALLNGLVWIPSQMQLAHGWTRLTVVVQSVAIVILAPAILWVVPRYGAIGAAWISVALNSAYILFMISLMHRRLLPQEKWRWYNNDVAMPLAAGTAAALICRALFPPHPGRILEFLILVLSAGLTLLSSAMAAPGVRRQIFRHLPGTIDPVSSTIARESV
jgi:O-antigen/teichoic acid export membrane protein